MPGLTSLTFPEVGVGHLKFLPVDNHINLHHKDEFRAFDGKPDAIWGPFHCLVMLIIWQAPVEGDVFIEGLGMDNPLPLSIDQIHCLTAHSHCLHELLLLCGVPGHGKC